MVSPIGILIESLTGGIKGSGQRYIKWVSGILLIGLCISLFASLIPIKENLSELPLLIVAAIILSLLNVWFFRRKVIASIVSVIFIALILSFYFPTTFETLKEKIRGIDISMAEPNRLYITDEDIKNERIKFFRSDGEPLIWYYRTGDGQFELFNRKGHHPIYKEKLKPVTPDVVDGIMKQLKAEVERRMQEEKKKREEAERLEREKKEEAERIAKQGVVETTELTNQQTEQNKFISLRLRQIWGVAYSYSKEKWAAGSYPEVRLSFVEGPFHAGTHIEWKGSQYFEGDQICLTISNLRLPKLVEGLEDFGFDYRPYYTDFGVGYFVQLDNAVFEEDYTLAKNIIISRTFKGDAPPKNIKKCFKVISIKKTDEKPYKISGEMERYITGKH
ncbi:MAG: hypothetical protein DDT18_02003 [Actinobacteria bacterium]|nr:hypothetical protein [Actinomycetota bacterium]